MKDRTPAADDEARFLRQCEEIEAGIAALKEEDKRPVSDNEARFLTQCENIEAAITALKEEMSDQRRNRSKTFSFHHDLH